MGEDSYAEKSNDEVLDEIGFIDDDEESVFAEFEEMYGRTIREEIEEEAYDAVDPRRNLDEEERERRAEQLGKEILDDLEDEFDSLQYDGLGEFVESMDDEERKRLDGYLDD
jgi:t-SNARE complex subunit (syntaxin)